MSSESASLNVHETRDAMLELAPSRPIRIAYLTGRLGIGGSEVHLARLVLGLHRTSYPTDVVVCHRGGVFEDRVIGAGVPVRDLDIGAGYSGFLRAIFALRRFLAETQPDILQTYGFTCDLLGTLAIAPWSRTRLLTTRRGNEPNRRRQRLYSMMNYVARRVLCVSEAARDHARRTEHLSGEQGLVIPNGLELSPYLAVPRVERPLRVIGTVGRLRHVKGSDLLLDAFSKIRRPDRLLRIAGPIFEDESLTREAWGKQLYDAHKSDAQVEFVGEIHDIPEFHGGIDIFVLPSRSEGMSNALIEAMAAGLPIVATRAGGNPETLGDGEAGMLVEPDADAIASAITHLIDHPEEARALGARARLRAQREYSLETMVFRYERFYQSLVDGLA